jgi:hypothetical protein
MESKNLKEADKDEKSSTTAKSKSGAIVTPVESTYTDDDDNFETDGNYISVGNPPPFVKKDGYH